MTLTHSKCEGSLLDLSSLASPEQRSAQAISARAGQGVPIEQEAPAPRQLHPSLDVALQEELTKVNSQRHDWIERAGEPNRAITRGT